MKNVLKRLGLLSLAVLMLVSLLALTACNGGEDETTKKKDDGTTTTTGGNPGPQPPANPTYTIKFVDQNGAPVQGVRVQFCVNETCTPMMAFPSNAEGIITITHMAENAYDVKILSLPSGYAEDTAYYHFNSENYLEIVLTPAA